MPKETYSIKKFGGLVDEPDPRDIRDEDCTVNSNLDPNSDGILRGVFNFGNSTTAIANVSQSEWIVRDGGEYDLVYTDGSNVKSHLDFYGTPSAGASISGEAKSFVAHNKQVYTGMGTSTNAKVVTRSKAAKVNGIITHTVTNGEDDLIIDATEYDGTAQTYTIKISSTSTKSGSFTAVQDAGQGYYQTGIAAFVDASHGITATESGYFLTISGLGTGNYDDTVTYTVWYLNDDSFSLKDNEGNWVLYNGNDTGNWTLQSNTTNKWQWKIGAGSYAPSGGLDTSEFAKIGSNGLKVGFRNPTDHAANDEWTVVFTSPNSEALTIEDSECYSWRYNTTADAQYIKINVSAGNENVDGFFRKDRKYFYAWSVIYDGNQLSPIGYRVKGDNPTSFVTATDYADLNIDFTFGYDSLPTRVTGFVLWRAEATDVAAEAPVGDFREVTTFYLDGMRTSSISGLTSAYKHIYKDIGGETPSYLTLTGIEESVERTSIKYSLSAEIDGRMFIADCGDDIALGVNDGSHMMFRSMEQRYSIFNYTRELLKLPTRPTAMFAFKNRIHIFDENRMYIIEPESFAIEASIEGAGCPYPQGWVVTEVGAFWAGSQAAYFYDGTEIRDITTRDIRSTYQDIFDETNFNGIKCVFDSEIKSILFAYRSGTTLKAATYHLSDKWGIITLVNSNTSDNWGLFAGKDGESYGSNQLGLAYNFSSASRRDWEYQSKNFDFGLPNQDKKFYHLRVDQTGSLTSIQYSLDGAAFRSLTNTTEIKDVSGNWERGKLLKVKLADNAGSQEAYSYTVEYRPLRLL